MKHEYEGTIWDNKLTASELEIFSAMKGSVYADGNMFCARTGRNIQEGCAGFGETRFQAISKWNSNFFCEKLTDITKDEK